MAELYATSADLDSYNAQQGSPYTLPSDADEKTALIEAAQFDLDGILGGYDLYESGAAAGHKLDPSTLTYTEDQALTRATCAQALYRIEMGPEFFTRPRVTSTGPEFSIGAVPAVIGALAMRELAGSGLIRNTVALGAERRRPRWLSFARNIDDD